MKATIHLCHTQLGWQMSIARATFLENDPLHEWLRWQMICCTSDYAGKWSVAQSKIPTFPSGLKQLITWGWLSLLVQYFVNQYIEFWSPNIQAPSSIPMWFLTTPISLHIVQSWEHTEVSTSACLHICNNNTLEFICYSVIWSLHCQSSCILCIWSIHWQRDHQITYTTNCRKTPTPSDLVCTLWQLNWCAVAYTPLTLTQL